MHRGIDRVLEILPPQARGLLERIGRPGRGVLLALALLVASGLGFAALAFRIAHGTPPSFDASALLALRVPGEPATGAGPRWMPAAMRAVTTLGGRIAALLAVGAVSVALLARRRFATLGLVAFTTTLGGLAINLLKAQFERPRPTVVAHLAESTNSSFPSGHAMLSAVVYLTLGAVLAASARRRWSRVSLLTGAVLLVLVVGFSRVYLGVHYPSDVLAGWAAGLAWVLSCLLTARAIQRCLRRDGLRH